MSVNYIQKNFSIKGAPFMEETVTNVTFNCCDYDNDDDEEMMVKIWAVQWKNMMRVNGRTELSSPQINT
jgi:hypothetical protein